MILQVGGYIYEYCSESTLYQPILSYTDQLVQHFPWKAIHQRVKNIKELQNPLLAFYNEPVNFWVRLRKEEPQCQEAIRQLMGV